MGDFAKKAENTLKELKSIFPLLGEIERVERTKALKYEIEIKNKLTNISIKIDELSSLLSFSQVSRFELEKRHKVVKEVKHHYETIQTKLKKSKSNPTMELMPTREKADYQRFSNADLAYSQEQLVQKQDSDIDQLLDRISNIKQTGLDIGEELTYHTQLLDQAERGVDYNTLKLRNIQNKMTRLIDKSSNSCLMCIIIALIVVLLLLIFYL